MATVQPTRFAPLKTALPAPGRIGKSPAKSKAAAPVDFFKEFADLPVKADDDLDLMTDPQEQYDEDLQEYTSGEILTRPGEATEAFDTRFRNDFFRYSRDYQDREGGAPGIDQDYGTPSPEEILSRPRSNASMDDRVREEILDLLSRDRALAADDVTAQVEDGLVILTGFVQDSDMRQAIEDAVQSVPGVESVENRLELG